MSFQSNSDEPLINRPIRYGVMKLVGLSEELRKNSV